MDGIIDLIFENLFVILLLVSGAVSQWIKSRNEGKDIPYEPEEHEGSPRDVIPQSPRPMVPPPISNSTIPNPARKMGVPPALPNLKKSIPAPLAPALSTANSSQEWDRQQQLADQLEELKRQKKVQRAPAFPSHPSPNSASSLGSVRDSFFDPRELRKAVIMREILDPPLALR